MPRDAAKLIMADQCVKRPLDRDDFDLEPSKRKRPCNPCTTQGSDSSSALQHVGKKQSSTRCNTSDRLRDERKRLLYVMRQVSDGSIVKKIRERLESEFVVYNSRLIQSLAGIFNSEDYPPPSHKYIKKCTDCGEEYDSRYNNVTSANICRQEHKVERTSKAVCGSGWECTECGQEWIVIMTTVLMAMTWVIAMKDHMKPVMKGHAVKTATWMLKINCV